ncbi:U1 protein [Faba bean yellow leaf virus]|uniref:U1 protein n=1 Tax=Faba bean yellow leaf virus TaxID=1137801 RepID=K4Q5R2_9VIRU|nr:U1 protein [Faba bean yellow leaf virus]CCF74118.1 U1 protein [Faba bean yellow leaf virus]
MAITHVSDSLLVDEASEEIITIERKLKSVECHDDINQVINVKVEDVDLDMRDRVVLKLQFRLCYTYKKKLDITLLGCRLKVHTELKNTSAAVVKSILQKRMNMICNGNYVIGIRLFFININQLINTCKWIIRIEDVYPICTLYHMNNNTDVICI